MLSAVAKRTQHVAPNSVAICCVDMLRSLGRDVNAHTGTGVGWWVEGWASILFGRRWSTPIASWRYLSTLVPDNPLGSHRTPQPFLLPLGTTHVQRELNPSEKWK